VADLVVDRGADRFGVGLIARRAVIQGRWDGALDPHHKVVTELVDLVCRDAGSDIGPDVVQHLGGKTAGHPHCSNFRTRFEANGHKGLKCEVAVDMGILPDF